MPLVDAVAVAQLVLTAIPVGGLANGVPYANAAMPNTSHVRTHLAWPVEQNGTARSLVDHICRYSSAHLDTAARNATADRCEIEVAVIVAIARTAAWRYYGWGTASLTAAEMVVVPNNTADFVVHADHEAAVIAALTTWAAPAARFVGLFYYNAISYETSAHHHLPAKTKKLASTTILLSGLKDWIAGNPEREGIVFHDCFHPVSDTEKSNAARRVSARDHLTNLRFDNLRKRIPVKAPDSGVAINYANLFMKARAYLHTPSDLPEGLAPPPSLAAAIGAYEAATTAQDLVDAVSKLRKMSEHLAEPSAYLAGFILGREASSTNDVDLDLRTAARTTTILGSPAYARAAGEFSGSFTAGRERGFKQVVQGTADQVIGRCLAGVDSAKVL